MVEVADVIPIRAVVKTAAQVVVKAADVAKVQAENNNISFLVLSHELKLVDPTNNITNEIQKKIMAVINEKLK